jgi:hypothetical protein
MLFLLEYEPGPTLLGAKDVDKERAYLTWFSDAGYSRMFPDFDLVEVWINALTQDSEVVRSTALDLLVAQTEVVN